MDDYVEGGSRQLGRTKKNRQRFSLVLCTRPPLSSSPQDASPVRLYNHEELVAFIPSSSSSSPSRTVPRSRRELVRDRRRRLSLNFIELKQLKQLGQQQQQQQQQHKDHQGLGGSAQQQHEAAPAARVGQGLFDEDEPAPPLRRRGNSAIKDTRRFSLALGFLGEAKHQMSSPWRRRASDDHEELNASRSLDLMARHMVEDSSSSFVLTQVCVELPSITQKSTP